MNATAPDLETAKSIGEKYLDGILRAERVVEGSSTYVYRIEAKSGTYYLRFLKENASFATEVPALNALRAAGVRGIKACSPSDTTARTASS